MSYTPEKLREQADRHERGSHHLDEVNREIWNEPTRQLRAHAALIEENARLKRHAEAMGRWMEIYGNEAARIILDAYRAEFKKEET